MVAKKKHRSTHEYLKYMKGDLSPEERHSFERDLEADPFEKEAMEGMEKVSADHLEEDLLSLHAGLQKRLSRRRRRTWYYVAATVASILIVGTVFINIYDIDPKTASESIPVDESFLNEDAGDEAELMEAEAARVMKAGEQAEDLEADAPAPVARGKEILQEVDSEKEIHEDLAPEVVAVEAQPKSSRKKDKALEKDVEEPLEELMEKREEELVEAPLAAPVAAPAEAAMADQKAFAGGRISGIVVSAEDMEPLPGASLLVRGADSGMMTDMEGRFAFYSDKKEPETLIASYVGMVTDEYKVEGGFDNQVVMRPDQVLLSEVVVIAYDVEESLYPTGAVQRVNLEPDEFTYRGAEPEGGLQAFKMYIEEQIRFPAGDSLSNREVVVLKFNVARDGSISHIQALRSPGKEFTEEAVRLLEEGPVWNPARNESGDTEDVVRMRIVFKR